MVVGMLFIGERLKVQMASLPVKKKNKSIMEVEK
jgi:hypothetical protein